MMFDGTSSEHERNDEDNKHFEEGSLYFIIAIWPRWSLIMVSTRRIKQYRISLSLCAALQYPVLFVWTTKKILPKKKQNMRSTQRHTKNHFQEPTQSHGPQAIFTYPFIDSKKKHPRAFISRVDLKLLNKVCRWDTPLLRTPCEVGGSGFVAAFVFQRNLSLPEIVF